MALDKTYRPARIEAKHYDLWEKSGAFASRPEAARSASPFTLMMPPPNVTGSLHMGHALNFTLQDILVRYHRMRGRDALWQPGTDHAGIATQMVVERRLEEMGESRHSLGREQFLKRIWDWKAESGGAITRQLRRLGASPDWARERFTLDEGLSRAVRKVFVELYKEGLIYRDKRLVNWDPKLHTAISDLEVAQREIKGKLWTFRYPIEGAEGEFIRISTTRPETLLGDSAVAVHPDDKRYQHLHGRRVVLPLVGRSIPIVADSYSDPEKGTGAVKITPAHDFNDFEVGRRHGLETINIFDENAALNDNVPEGYRGLDRFEAREKVVAELQSLGLVESIEDYVHTVPHGDRSGVTVEPWLTDQWFVDAKTLAAPAIEAVETGRMAFVPRHWENTYFEWMRNIQPWCISRQIWWGHQIPAWYGPDGVVFVETTEEEAQAAAHAHYGTSVTLRRDEDVLDTWFSSALWPFSTLGWPDETPELARYYPTDVLVTGFDIIFFWVARMMMMGLRFMGDVPFRTVYIHALVRDLKGQKMSKSKGNVLDPVELIDRYGCDALRFTMAALAAPGRDIRLAESRVEGYRNFMTKLWNAARYCQLAGCAPAAGFDPAKLRETVNRWIVGETVKLSARVAEAIEAFRFNEAANHLYQFIWHGFCDWYLEFTKPILAEGDAEVVAETKATTAWVFDELLHLLHPFAPFITEELWEQMAAARASRLITAQWPRHEPALIDEAASSEMAWVTRLVSEVRAVRAEMHVPAAARIPLILREASDTTQERVAAHGDLIRRLARIDSIEFADGEAPKGSVQLVLDGAIAALPLGQVIDIESERARLVREIEKLTGEIARIEAKLGNGKFLEKAPDEVVETQRQRRREAQAAQSKITAALERLVSL